LARKTVYTGDDIVAAALEVVDNLGIADLTARRVADRLGASTAPVYSNFASMEELQSAVVHRAKDLLLAYTEEQHTADPFLDMGVGVTKFARDHRNLYRVLFLDQIKDYDPSNDVFYALLDRLAADPELGELPEVVRGDLLDVLATFTHGLATAVCTGLADDYDQETITAYLSEVGDIFIEAARTRAGAGTTLFPDLPANKLCHAHTRQPTPEDDHED